MDKINFRLIYLIGVFAFSFLLITSCKLYEDNEFTTFQGVLIFEDGTPAQNIEVVFANEILLVEMEGFSWNDASNGIYRGKTNERGVFKFVVPKKNFQFALSARDNFDPLYYLYIEPDFVFGVEKNDEITEEIYLFLNEYSINEQQVLDLSNVFIKPL
ncbi:DUF4198 domain-containing protein [Belliella sp. DSM 107340]|uniref:DUF4198 domain-containing protein n=1 Tax=Belliella calami TaxID=2923436 RepID=A0ABS9USE8_9BACT|nr:DUF4198 domain-containing protein [Belliella calami]MCH7399543.1 DUF4198 domain-containing protein [Belliella calami]